MPSSTTASHRRHGGQRSQRHRRNVSFPRSGHPARRPQLRDQACADVGECFDLCQERGLHLDPDVKIGSAAGNRFSVLETLDARMPTPPATPPQCPFTFSLPLPHSSRDPSEAAKDSPRQSPSQQAETTGKPVRRMTNDTGFHLKLPSISMTPTSAPEVRLPKTHSCELGDARIQPEPPFLHDFVIPSPLLYHSQSREELLGVPGEIDDSKSGKVVCGREPSDPKFESFKLGSPLQLPCDDRQSHSFRNPKSNGIDDMDFHSINDPAFYRHTRTYLRAQYERNTEYPVTVPSKFEPPIVTTTNTLKRQTHIYPGEYALNPPITLPSSNASTASLVIGVAEQPSPAPASAVNLNESCGCKGQTNSDADLATPPPEENREKSPATSSETINNGRKGRRKRRGRAAKKTISANPNFQEMSSGGNETCDSLVDLLGLVPDEEIAGTSAINNACTARANTYKAPATPSHLPVAVPTPSTPKPNLPAANPAAPSSPVASPPSPLGHACAEQTLDMIQLQACPTSTCTASVVIMPTPTRKLVSDCHPDKCSRLSAGRRDMELAARKFAEELGFETEHGNGCAFGGEWGMSDEEGETGGGSGGVETGRELRKCGSGSPAAKPVEGQDCDGDGVGGVFGERWEDEWVGEGEAADFWI